MAQATLTLRLETPADWRAVENLTREAFWNHHAPGCDEHYLAHILRESPAFLPELDFVAELNGRVVGNIMYTRARIVRDRGGEVPVISFGPLSVLPACQRQGVGRRLIEHTRALAGAAGHAAILIYGDPDFYTRCGLVPAQQYGIATADGRYGAPLLACELRAGALAGAAGRFVEDEVFAVDAAASAAFDAGFPAKEKVEGLPSQRRFVETLQMFHPREE